MTANAEANSISGGGFALAVMLPEASVSGATRAFVRDGTAIIADDLKVLAGTAADRIKYFATAKSWNLAIALVAGVGVDADANVNGVVEAFIGATRRRHSKLHRSAAHAHHCRTVDSGRGFRLL